MGVDEVQSNIIHVHKSSDQKLIFENMQSILGAKEENKIAPMLPEIVLLGLIDVSLGPFKIFPIVNPPISEKTQIIKIINKIIFK